MTFLRPLSLMRSYVLLHLPLQALYARKTISVLKLNSFISPPFYKHRVIERFGLERTLKIMSFQPPATGRGVTHYTRLLNFSTIVISVTALITHSPYSIPISNQKQSSYLLTWLRSQVWASGNLNTSPPSRLPGRSVSLSHTYAVVVRTALETCQS